MEEERHFSLYLCSLSIILYLLTFIFELNHDENPVHKNMHSPKIKYTKAGLMNLKPKVYITKMDTEICNHIKHLKIKQNFRRKRVGRKYAQESGIIIMEFTITYCSH